VDSLTSESIERNGNDAEAQRVARAAIMEMPAFPELERRLISVLGPTSEAIMIHQLVYWFSKRKMQNRWSAYKTYKEWKDERGLNRKQVDKGRKRLNANKLVEEKYGNYKRIEYQVDWVKLAELLLIPLKGGQSYDLDDLKDDDFDVLGEEPLYPLKGGQSSSDIPKGGTVQKDTPLMDDTPDTYAENSSFGGVQSNARDYSEDYLTEESTLQVVAPEPVYTEPGAHEMNGKKEKEEQPLTTERHSQNGHTRSETTAVKDEVEQVVAPPKPDDDTLLAEVKEILDSESGRWWGAANIAKHKDTFTAEKVAGYIITNAEDIKQPEVVTSVPRDKLEQAVGYVRWEAVA
jgi:hypothetical protein